MTAGTARKPPVFGPEDRSELAGRPWSYWDYWFTVVAVSDHNGSLDELEAHLVGALRGPLDGRQGAEWKVSHLADLRSRLDAASLTPADLATPEALADKRLLTRARSQVPAHRVDGRAMTPAMIETPRVRLLRRARCGDWSAVPIAPRVYYRSFRRRVEGRQRITKYQSFAAADQVEHRLGDLDRPSLNPAGRLARYRAVHAAGWALATRTDDSHGNVGQLRRNTWHTYLDLDWQAAGIPAEAYWADPCDLIVFQDYGLGHQEETLPWRRVPAGQLDLVERRLLGLASECRSYHLDFQTEAALQQIAWLAAAGRRFSRYVEAASGLGSDHRMPVEAMAESALRSGLGQLAVEVFQAADRAGLHQQHLRRRCLELTGVELDDQRGPRPKLRVLPGLGGRP